MAILWLSAPATLAALGIGLAASVVQTTMQLQEQTLSFVPKLLAVCLALIICGGWMLTQLVRLAAAMFEQIPTIGN